MQKNFKISFSFCWFIPLLLLVGIEILKTQPFLIERYYALGVYPFIGQFFRFLFGWIPFSMGDLMVAVIIVILLFRVIVWLKKKPWKHNRGKPYLPVVWSVVRCLVWIYILFHIVWGFNYYRLGSAHLLGISPDPYTTNEVALLSSHLQDRLKVICRDSAAIERSKTGNRRELQSQAEQAYRQAEGRYPFLHFRNSSLKPNLIGPLQSYTGYSGYMFPFTGEAHANFHVPAFSLPFTVCHEMAHQVGFATESEANLAGFLAARESSNPAFVYSALAGIHQYAIIELFNRDSIRARAMVDSLPPLLKKDRKEQREFYLKHQSFMQPVLNAAYNFYLLTNNQPEGLESYNYVVAWLISYAKKYGWDAI